MGQRHVIQFNKTGPQREVAKPERGKILWVMLEDLMKALALVSCVVRRVAVNVDRSDLGAPSDQFGDVIKYFCVRFFTSSVNGDLLNAG